MRNIESLINQLSAEAQRHEHLIIEDLEEVKKACGLFFDKQQREMDAFYALINKAVEDVSTRVKNGYPKDHRMNEDYGQMPAIVTGRSLTNEEREEIMKSVGEAA